MKKQRKSAASKPKGAKIPTRRMRAVKLASERGEMSIAAQEQLTGKRATRHVPRAKSGSKPSGRAR
jgi:hypothetical protein